MSDRTRECQPAVFISGGAGGLAGITARYLGERGWRVFAAPALRRWAGSGAGRPMLPQVPALLQCFSTPSGREKHISTETTGFRPMSAL
jgi:hypothetical protein